MLNRIQAVYVVAQDQEQVDKLLEMKEQLPHVRKIIYLDQTGMRTYTHNPWLMSFKELLDLGADLDSKQPHLFEEELWKGKPEEGALMIMTFPETPETATEDFREIGPAVIITSSRFWEDLASKIRVKIADAGWIKRRLFALGEKIGGAVVDHESKKEPVPSSLRLLHRLADRVVYRSLLDRVGCGQIRAAVTGGHPISPDVLRFFRAQGLNLKHAYGLTEGGGVFQVQPDREV